MRVPRDAWVRRRKVSGRPSRRSHDPISDPGTDLVVRNRVEFRDFVDRICRPRRRRETKACDRERRLFEIRDPGKAGEGHLEGVGRGVE
jgi:CelD/BcsL family acetyltransferase involved in cellulose biosynthesis